MPFTELMVGIFPQIAVLRIGPVWIFTIHDIIRGDPVPIKVLLGKCLTPPVSVYMFRHYPMGCNIEPVLRIACIIGSLYRLTSKCI